MGISIMDFKGNVADVARPNRFLVSFRGTAVAGFDPKMQYLVKGTSIPGRDIGDITVNWQGMQIKLAGDPTFADIDMTFINDLEFSLRNLFEEWADNIALMSTNERTTHADYKAEVVIQQIGRTMDEVLATYVLEGAYPKNVAAIALAMDTNDTVEEFTVSFRYDQFYREDTKGAEILPKP
jgi:hypothetical protein